MRTEISEQKESERTPSDWREGRRLRAYELHKQGWKQYEIAEALGISQGLVSQIIKAAKEQGVAGLRRRKASGAPLRLKREQRQALLELLQQGNKIEAIRIYREASGSGLKEAKDAVEALGKRRG